MRSLIAVCFLGLAGGAQAACFGGGTPMFHCTFSGGAKTVDVCLQGDIAVYSFGATGRAPDMLLGRRDIGVHMTPWNGIGRAIWEEITFYNNVYSYILSYSIDRNIEGAPVVGRLVVAEGDSELAELICDTGSVTEADFYPLFESKEISGQRYCPDTFSWGAGC